MSIMARLHTNRAFEWDGCQSRRSKTLSKVNTLVSQCHVRGRLRIVILQLQTVGNNSLMLVIIQILFNGVFYDRSNDFCFKIIIFDAEI